jgi:uncharacterized protein (DUF305 family)
MPAVSSTRPYTLPDGPPEPRPYAGPLDPHREKRQNVTPLKVRGIAAALFLPALVFACSPSPSPGKPADRQMAGMSMPVIIPKGALYTEADVHFMQGMIAHHAQAIYMSRMATARGANPRVLKFAHKIDQSQQAEIRLMQDWLVANKQSAPDTSAWRTMTMPGMLTPAQLAQLNAAHGPEFDKQFLTLMIQHHEGALKMVADLLATPMAAQDIDVSVFANDIDVVQTAEIATMQQMLSNL